MRRPSFSIKLTRGPILTESERERFDVIELCMSSTKHAFLYESLFTIRASDFHSVISCERIFVLSIRKLVSSSDERYNGCSKSTTSTVIIKWKSLEYFNVLFQTIVTSLFRDASRWYSNHARFACSFYFTL